MSYIKQPQEIEKIITGGKILGEVLETISKMAKPGISAWEIDQEAERLIVKAGGKPAFKHFRSSRSEPPFPTTICASVNEEIVHGIATKDKILKAGDIFSIDIGMQWPVGSGEGQDGNGFFTDTALAVVVGNVPKETQKLLWATQEALEAGLEQCVIGNTVADVGRAVEDYVRSKGNYGIVRDLVGHGVGHAVHEEPRVPNYYDKNLEKWILQEGTVIAIEPMVTMGDYRIKTASDGWSISTVDDSLSAHFEHTVVITKEGPIVVTRRPAEL